MAEVLCRIGACLRRLCLVVLLATAGAVPSLAQPAKGESFAGPAGWQALCKALPAYCNRHGSTAHGPPDAAARAGLAAVNLAVNAAIDPEEEDFGRDLWRLAPVRGDCEDYALTKKYRLQNAGWPAARLRFATVLTEHGDYHAVLFVDTSDGPLVLDNRFEEVLPFVALEALGYRLVAVEGEGVAGSWRLTPYGTVVATLVGTVVASEP